MEHPKQSKDEKVKVLESLWRIEKQRREGNIPKQGLESLLQAARHIPNDVAEVLLSEDAKALVQDITATKLTAVNEKLHNFCYGVYIGEANMNGRGSLILFNGNVYSGDFSNKHAAEKIAEQNLAQQCSPQRDIKQKISGWERNGQLELGRLITERMVYNGHFSNFLKEGQGFEYPLDWRERQNEIFSGTFRHNKKNGIGKESRFSNELTGEWRNGKKNGTFTTNAVNGASIRSSPLLYFINDQKVAVYEKPPQVVPFEKLIGVYAINEVNLSSLKPFSYISPNVLKAYYYLLLVEYRKLASLLRRKCKRVKILTEAVENMVGQDFNQSSIEGLRNSAGNLECPGYGSTYSRPIYEYYDVMLFPIQIRRQHFALIDVRVHRQKEDSKGNVCYTFEINYMDSMRYEIEQEVELLIKKYLRNELDRNTNLDPACKDEIANNIAGAKLRTPQSMKLPQQPNSYNCGVWVATYVRNILRQLLTGVTVEWNNISEGQVESLRSEIQACLRFESVRILGWQ